MKNKTFRAYADRMTGVAPALEPDDIIGFLREKIDNFSFALIAPLRAYKNNV